MKYGYARVSTGDQNSALQIAVLKKAGVEHQFIVVTNAPHTFNLMPPQQDLRPAVMGFLDKHLKPGSTNK